MNFLQEMYEGLGFKNVKTYIQSGNVVFQEKETQLDELESKISKEILKRFSFNISVLLGDKTDLK